ncbi:copper uptake system-associated protein (plasmid) [Rhizobium sp. WSM1274]|uniref:copper uptake system-associated protein n=1 Tax=Rhizobium sp. WSM1274 TaxID=3138254 RepID=UPI0021A7CB8F|nr:copper uptake system-associated protein [Rhizobium leguminosarum]UWU31795.1 copper uptake system-associated protein [Rhizobium leguminosarum bv. viciae]
MKTFAIFAASLLIASAAFAEDYKVGNLIISHPASHAMVPGAKVGDGFVTITNNGEQPDTLIAARSQRAGLVQGELKGGLSIPAGQTVKLEPNYHLMFMNVEKPFKQGEKIEATLTFEKASEVPVTFAVGKIAGPLGPDDDQSRAMDMKGMDMSSMPMPDDPQQTIPKTLKTMFETADKPLTVEPVVVQADWAIAGWQQDGRGGRALLKKGHHGWRVHLCSGDGIKDAASLQKIGLSTDDAAALAAKLRDAETTIDPKVLALFASFEGTVMMADDASAGAHAGHEGHSK